MAENTGGKSQRAAAMAAFAEASKQKEAEKEFTPSSQLSAREKAMQNLNRKGVVSNREARGATGESQHGKALARLGIQDDGPKVVPAWKLTAAQKNAAAARAEIKGSSTHAEAVAKFGGDSARSHACAPPSTFVPLQQTPGGPPKVGGTASKFGGGSTPRAEAPKPAPRPVAPPVAGGGAMASNTAEAAEGVEKDLAFLISNFPRLGNREADGSITTTFGTVVDDEVCVHAISARYAGPSALTAMRCGWLMGGGSRGAGTL